MGTVQEIKAKSTVWPLYGELGVLTYDPVEDKVQCHICGRWFRGLGAHSRQRHGWTADDYREEFGLNKGQSLICESTRQRLSDLNKQNGNWKHLISQTSTKEELSEFMRSICPGPSRRPRLQVRLLQSQRLKEYNPMNEPEVIQRRIETERKTWYGSPRMRELARANIRAAIATVRRRNLESGKYTCSCGAIFPIRDDLRKHIKENSCKLES